MSYCPDFGVLAVGCQVHTVSHWREHWRELADEHDVYIEEADVMVLLDSL